MTVLSTQNPNELLTESITSNAAQLWERFNTSPDCFKSKISEPVKIVDVLPTGDVNTYPVTSEDTLHSYLKPKTAFKLRLMCDIRYLFVCANVWQLNMPIKLMVADAGIEGDC
jgi:hypothetical protein